MKNPLRKRIKREIFGEIGKYIAIFLFMLLSIGFISGFLVAASSMKTAYDNSFEKYNIENGNFTLAMKADDALISDIEKENVKLYELFYKEENAIVGKDDNEATIRIYKDRKDIDLICVMDGEMPQNDDEIALDRMFADNNGISTGDEITVGDIKLKVSGLVAFSDYSALFSNNNDIMFDAVKFSVAIVTDSRFDELSDDHETFCYGWKYNNEPSDDKEEKNMSDDFMKALASKALLTNYIPRYQNQAINFTGDDIGSDSSLMIALLYIIIAIMAFVFAVTINHTIDREASVIGTLRASGYTKGELVRHYLAPPMIVSLVAAVAGNIIGYTIFKNIAAGMYYGSYSLPTYVTIWNAKAFILTTAVPLIIMLVINIISLNSKFKISPLKFIRHDISRHKRKKAVKLPHFKFFTRFRIRVIFQNIPNFIVLFVGMLFTCVLLLFGMMMLPLLEHQKKETLSNMISKYQYILKAPADTDTADAEKYSAGSYKYDGDELTVYGIAENSVYYKEGAVKDGVAISDCMADKYRLEVGDKIKLCEEYTDGEYKFTVDKIVKYPASIAVFMEKNKFNDTFGKDADYYTGYFSNTGIKDIGDKYIASCITEEDLTKVTRQLEVSMGNIFYLFYMFAVIMAALLIYLLTKLVLEKNANSISMVKILGYENSEIARLYLFATSWVVAISTVISIAASTFIIKVIYRPMMSSMSGWLILWYDKNIYWKMFLIIMATYVVVALLQFRKIKKIPMDQALKNVE